MRYRLLLLGCSLLSVQGWAQTFAYVSNFGGNDISGFQVDPATGQLIPLDQSPFGGVTSPIGLTSGVHGRLLIVTSPNVNSVASYTIDDTGTLTQASAGVPTGANPTAVAVTGYNAYVINSGSNSISGYTIDGLGNLSELPSSPFEAGIMPTAIAIHPLGTLAFVTNQGTNDITVFAINLGTGSLSSVGNPSLVTGSFPSALAVHPSGQFLYVAYAGTNTIVALQVEQISGALFPLGGPVPTGSLPRALAIDPMGRFLYAANAGSSTVTGYAIAPDGTLILLGQFAIPNGSSPTGLSVDPTGSFLYTANNASQNVSGFTLDPGGVPTPLGDAFPTDPNPFCVGTVSKDENTGCSDDLARGLGAGEMDTKSLGCVFGMAQCSMTVGEAALYWCIVGNTESCNKGTCNLGASNCIPVVRETTNVTVDCYLVANPNCPHGGQSSCYCKFTVANPGHLGCGCECH